MQNLIKSISILAGAAMIAICGSMLMFVPVMADVAPPESPPGVIISPGTEVTQVRMVSEVVTLTLLTNAAQSGKAATTADFVMRNLGSADENMSVRFPLTFGEALYTPGIYPEIKDFKAKVGGVSVPTTITTSLDATSGGKIPWANFSVKFPVGQDVKISVTYTAQGFGRDPNLSFRYILETGAGWKDSIGSGDIIMHLPYPANNENVFDFSGGGQATSQGGGPVFSGNEVSLHFENLEPTRDDNIEVTIMSPAYWNNILAARDYTVKNPQDGEGWGRLGKVIKETITDPKGFLMVGEAGDQFYSEAVLAYEKAVKLLPKDALWHFGFADLLWSHYFYNVFSAGLQDNSGLTRMAEELKASLQIDPGNQRALDLASQVSDSLPWAISKNGQAYDFLVLTATPTAVPDTATPVPPTAEISPTASPTATAGTPTAAVKQTLTPQPAGTTPTARGPAANNPLCGSILVFPLLIGLLWLIAKRHS